ncbi:MAG: flavodoxin family protein [Gammaproteobacteria bacterium]|nr:flavodoxin family protein [Gammaproteobacteria bacterium]
MTSESDHKQLLLVYHSQTGHTRGLMQAVLSGARDPQIDGVHARLLRAADAGVADLLQADALVLGTPENFGYMSGAMKDFLDRVYYPCQGRIEGLAYALVISAGNDGQGAQRSIERIVRGFPLRQAQAPIIVRGTPGAEDLGRCEELGATMAASLSLGLI